MKKRIAWLVAGLLLVGGTLYAANGDLIVNGNVGIGTTSPPTAGKLVVQGIYPQLVLNNPTAGAGSRMDFQNAGTTAGVIGHLNTPDRLQFSGSNASAVHMTITSSGNVGIGKTDPIYQLQLNTDSAGKPNGGSWANSSDKRLKKNIIPLSGALDKILKLNPVAYEWINPEEHGAKEKEVRAGFIAQEIEKEFPLWVNEYSPNEKSKDAKLIPAGDKAKDLRFPNDTYALLVQAIKEQQKQIEALNAEIAVLKQMKH